MSVEYLTSGQSDVLAMRVVGSVSVSDMSELMDRIEAIAQTGKVRLYIDIRDYSGVDLGAAREKLAHFGTLWSGIDRCGYVVDQAWMTTVMPLVDAVTPMHVRAFAADAADEAMAWVLADDSPA